MMLTVMPCCKVLNNLYEASYPGLRFITFVNGRSRAEIIPEFEVSLLAAHKRLDADRSCVAVDHWSLAA